MKIVILDAMTLGEETGFDIFQSFGEVVQYATTSPEQTALRLHGATCIITNKVVINRKHLEENPSVRLICVAATGMNNIDLKAAQELGVKVKNVSGYSTEGVAQHTLAMILYGNQHLWYYSQYTRNEYCKSPFFSHHGKTIYLLKGKTIGILGLGAIGLAVARLAESFGMHVIYHSLSGNNVSQPYRHVSWKELLSNSDVISIHAPLSSLSYHIFDEAAFSLMKKDSIIVNTGRGGIIDEMALIKALSHDDIGFAALDVFEKEPIEPLHPLLSLPPHKLLLTPHIAWAAIESRKKLVSGIFKNIEEFLTPSINTTVH
ncbi:MAG: hydroxyacid dehydrogenase [Cytophagaceae bacterium]|jgi:glycerate dehydrogenase|nr:hydroxyacid dehydrogenase [Cytophagaceae bacterium]